MAKGVEVGMPQQPAGLYRQKGSGEMRATVVSVAAAGNFNLNFAKVKCLKAASDVG